MLSDHLWLCPTKRYTHQSCRPVPTTGVTVKILTRSPWPTTKLARIAAPFSSDEHATDSVARSVALSHITSSVIFARALVHSLALLVPYHPSRPHTLAIPAIERFTPELHLQFCHIVPCLVLRGISLTPSLQRAIVPRHEASCLRPNLPHAALPSN
ncbi:hypothetical protein B0H13DRAFT_2319350 [Mycena leptocephala]|nr:hypothetical protein B0H13DRAFT_2319350 [Mycena leptocephala]